MTECILILHPDSQKAGMNIDKGKYDLIRAAILEVLSAAPEVSFSALRDAVRKLLGDSFPGSVSWYVTTVKLDLKVRGLIERVPGKKPQYLRIPE